MNFILFLFAFFRTIVRNNLFPGLGEKDETEAEGDGRRLRAGGGSASSSSSGTQYKIGDIDQYWLLFRIIVVIITFTFILFKILFYLKVFENFGKIVTLINSIGEKSRHFLGFLLITMLYYTGIYRILGEDFSCQSNDKDCIDD